MDEHTEFCMLLGTLVALGGVVVGVALGQPMLAVGAILGAFGAAYLKIMGGE